MEEGSGYVARAEKAEAALEKSSREVDGTLALTLALTFVLTLVLTLIFSGGGEAFETAYEPALEGDTT